MDISKIEVIFQPRITEDQLWDFYNRNNICEVGFGKEVATKPLRSNCVIVAAFYGSDLVGIIRAFFDGISAIIAEFCLELNLQGENLYYENGSLLEKDDYGIAKKMGELLIDELRKKGNTSVSTTILQNCEEKVYLSLGMKQNDKHVNYVIVERQYVK